MNIQRNQNPLLILILLLSLLLHLALLRIVPKPSFEVRATPKQLTVRMLPPPVEQLRDLDIPVRPEAVKPREKPARRLGPADQVVEKEMAPRGESLEDMRPDAAAPQAEQPKAVMVAPQPVEQRSEAAPASETSADRGRPMEPAPAKTPTETTAVPMPSVESLLQLPQTTVARLDREWRQKYRKDVEEGDAVWLDSEQDLLYSFFQRLRTNIYNVWNYPPRAAEQGRSGACLLQIVVNRDGTLQSVEIKETSGHPDLDRAATAAVRKGAPYGALPQAFDKESLKILAFFHYELSRNPFKHPGRIY